MDSRCVNVFFFTKKGCGDHKTTSDSDSAIWYLVIFDSSPIVFKICAALKWGKKGVTGRRRTSSLVFSLPITLLPSIPLTLVAPILTTGDESRNPLDARLLRIWGRIIHKSPSRLQCQCMRASSQLSASRTNWKAWENTVRKGRYLHILFKCFPRAFQTQMKITGDLLWKSSTDFTITSPWVFTDMRLSACYGIFFFSFESSTR